MKRHYDNAQTRKGITEKAALLFSQKGFAGTSISDISKELGFSKDYVYYHFIFCNETPSCWSYLCKVVNKWPM